MKSNSSFCCRQSISGRPPKWNRSSHLGNYPGFYVFVNLFLLCLLVKFLVSFLFQLLYLRDFLDTEIPVFMVLRDMRFSTNWRMEKGFFILSNLKAIDFGSKVFSYLSPALKFFFLLASHFCFFLVWKLSSSSCQSIQHSSLLFFRCQSFLII
jgi:hypothetical protein